MEQSIRIKKVILENYRNFGYKEIDFNGKSKILVGKNGLGKTNIIEAIFWLLNNQLFSGDSKTDKIGITPTNADNGTKTRVSVEFEPTFTFEKIFYEKYDKEGNYKGSETSYYVNGGLIKQNGVALDTLREYLGIKKLKDDFSTKKLKNIDTMSLFYNLNYLTTIDYSLLRELIVDIVGEVNYGDVIKSKPSKYKRLVEPLTQHNGDVEALHSATRTTIFGDKNKRGLNDEIATTEDLISEYTKSANQEIDEEEIKVAKGQLETIDNEISRLQNKKSSVESGSTQEIELEISKKENELSKAREIVRETYDKDLEAHRNVELEQSITSKQNSLTSERNKRFELSEKIQDKQSELNNSRNTLQNKKTQLTNLEEQRTTLLEKYKTLSNQKVEVKTMTCPHCNKVIELEDLELHKQEHAKQLAEINKQGQDNKLKREQLTEGIDTLSYEIEQQEKYILSLNKERDTIDKRITTLSNELQKLQNEQQNNNDKAPTLDYNVEPILTIQNELKDLETRKDNAKTNVQEEVNKVEEEIEAFKVQKLALQETVNKEITRKHDLEKAQDKKKELEILNNKLTSAEEILLLVKELQKDMFTLLNEKVEDKFGENIQFRLFKINIDGSVDTRVCDMLVKDIHGNFINLKNINSGMFPVRALEFISKVKAHYELPKSFIFIDEMIGLLDKKHREMVYANGEQVIATGYEELEKLEIKE
jgi:chromosome segregation protein